MSIRLSTLGLSLVMALVAPAAFASNGNSHDAQISDQMSRSGFVLENGLAVPAFDPVLGRKLFASKGCVVCHSINGVGGEDAPEFSAEWMDPPMNAFDFAAKMWRGAGAMIMMQEEELGGQIELDGAELAAIVAFVHDPVEQQKFSQADIPHDIEELMHGGEGDHGDEPEAEQHDDAGQPTGHDEG